MKSLRASAWSGPRGRRPWAAAAALVACAGLAAACGSSSSAAGNSAHTPIKVGYLLPLTGVFTRNGTSELDGFKLGLAHFGASADGHPIQAVPPWGTLSPAEWTPLFAKTSVSPPSF